MALVYDLIRDVQQKVRACPRQTVANAYVRAARDFCTQSRWYRIALSAEVVANQYLYSLGSDPHIEVIDVPLGSIVTNPAVSQQNVIPLINLPTNAFNPNVLPATPIWFAYVPEGQVAFNPTPDQTYPVMLTLACQPRDNSNYVPDELLPKWRLSFEAGALSYLYGLSGEVWADPREAEKQRLIFQSAVNSGKASVAMSFQSGSQRATPRRFVVR